MLCPRRFHSTCDTESVKVGLEHDLALAYSNIVMIFQAILDVAQELEHVQLVQTGLHEGVHALKGCLAQVQPIIHCVFEWPHLHLTD